MRSAGVVEQGELEQPAAGTSENKEGEFRDYHSTQQDDEEDEGRPLGRPPSLDVKIVEGNMAPVDRAEHLRHDTSGDAGSSEENFQAVEEEDGESQPRQLEVQDPVNLSKRLHEVSR